MDANNTIYNKFFRQALFLLALIAIGVVIFVQLKFFLGCFLGAITLYIVLRRPFFYLTKTRGWGIVKASLLVIALSATALIAIGVGVFNVLYTKFATANLSSLFGGINVIADKIYHLTGYHIIPKDIIVQSKDMLMNILSSFLNTTYSIGANVFMMFVVLYFMLARARQMEYTITNYIPFHGKSLLKIENEIKNIIFSNAVGIPLIMFGQACVAALGYWIFGVSDAIFWGFLTGLFGIVPLLGTTLIWLPISVYLIAAGSMWNGIILGIYGLLIIGNADNVIRLILLKKAANVHPLITIFGVIMGIPLFGFWGIIFGPLLISSFLLLIKTYYAEYSAKLKEKEPAK
ncbi:MAG: AI-2E family transporter [Prevotellaceae bacterium]|jgi:predicted PurR-regulated permease PerM|nr:AI-2E family transporter [Prevotellaceae bacterium]